VYSSISTLAVGLPKYQDKLVVFVKMAEKLSHRVPELSLQDVLKNINLGAISSFVLRTMGSFMKFFTSLSLMILFFIFMLIGKGNLERKIHKAFPEYQALYISAIYKNLTQKIYRYLWIKTLISAITGFNVWLILTLFGIDFAFVWGFLTFAFNYIPNIGSIIITIPPLILAFLKFGRFFPVFWLLLLLIANQMVMGNFLEPRWMGKSLNLSPLLVLFSLIFWGWLWGVVGMIISVPLLSIIKIILENIPQTSSWAKLMEA
jgi:predicted PurR-regulated permease PerM